MGSTESIPVELATLVYGGPKQVIEIAFRVYGGSRHLDRLEAANRALEDWTTYLHNSEGTVISIDSYEVASKTTDSGTPYVEFRYGNYQEIN